MAYSTIDKQSLHFNTKIYSGVIILDKTQIGKCCIIQAGAIIGSEGFGFNKNEDGKYSKTPQIGNVVIKDNVEIGANTTIDRATLGSTIIEPPISGCPSSDPAFAIPTTHVEF